MQTIERYIKCDHCSGLGIKNKPQTLSGKPLEKKSAKKEEICEECAGYGFVGAVLTETKDKQPRRSTFKIGNDGPCPCDVMGLSCRCSLGRINSVLWKDEVI